MYLDFIWRILVHVHTCKFYQKLCTFPTNKDLHKVNYKNTRKRWKICSKLTLKTPEKLHWRHSGVFIAKLLTYSAPFFWVPIDSSIPNFTPFLWQPFLCTQLFLLVTSDWEANYQGICLSDNFQCKSLIFFQSSNKKSNAFNETKIRQVINQSIAWALSFHFQKGNFTTLISILLQLLSISVSPKNFLPPILLHSL